MELSVQRLPDIKGSHGDQALQFTRLGGRGGGGGVFVAKGFGGFNGLMFAST